MRPSWSFSIDLGGDINTSPFKHLKSCQANSLSGKTIASGFVAISGLSARLAIFILVPQTQVELKEGYYELSFTLSDQPSSAVVAATTGPAPANPSVGDNLLDRLYNDTASQDVFFVFSNATEGEDNTATREDIDAEKLTIMGESQAQLLALEKVSVGAKTTIDTETILGAHRLVLTQWPYFRAVFDGGFTESSPGEKRIMINDVQADTFKLLLRFMYTGKLPLDAQPKNVYTSFMTKQHLSWEQIFAAAYRYNIPELCQLAQEKILTGLSPSMSVDFLFRTGYQYDELRGPVIKYIAKNCGSQVATKTSRDKYKNHPDIIDILGELFEQYFSLHK
ncbi:hypothetical protein CPC16_006187 [Podila verticillata]|nr:hypothetical protein CPC16_006187 [Podila verticillata]